MIPQRDYSGQISCKNRRVTNDVFSKDWCNKRGVYCCYSKDCRELILVNMEEFMEWFQGEYDNPIRLAAEASWKAAMQKAIEFAKEIPTITEGERRIIVALTNRIEKELGHRDCA